MIVRQAAASLCDTSGPEAGRRYSDCSGKTDPFRGTASSFVTL